MLSHSVQERQREKVRKGPDGVDRVGSRHDRMREIDAETHDGADTKKGSQFQWSTREQKIERKENSRVETSNNP